MYQPDSLQNCKYVDKMCDVIYFTTGFGQELEEWTTVVSFRYLIDLITLGREVQTFSRRFRFVWKSQPKQSAGEIEINKKTKKTQLNISYRVVNIRIWVSHKWAYRHGVT